MNAIVSHMFPLPPRLRGLLALTGWQHLHDSLFACNLTASETQTKRGVWLTRRSSDSIEVMRPVARDDHNPVPVLYQGSRVSAGDVQPLDGKLVLVESLRFTPNVHTINRAALVMAHCTPRAPWELDLPIESGWSPFASAETWQLRRWWADDGRTDW